MTEYQQDAWLEILTERFGPNPLDWAFECPSCGDIATGADFRAALADHPHKRHDGTPVMASDLLGRECIGRTLGALSRAAPKDHWDTRRKRGEVRGCDWCAYGLFRGPDSIITDVGGDVHTLWAFPIAPARSGPV